MRIAVVAGFSLLTLVGWRAVCAADPPMSPACKVFLHVTVSKGDAWGDSFVGNLREGLLKSARVTLVPSEEEAGLEVGVVTLPDTRPGSTVVSRLLMLVVRTPLPAEVPRERENATVRMVVRGPLLGIYGRETLAEGVTKTVDAVTDPRMLAACEKLSTKAVAAPAR